MGPRNRDIQALSFSNQVLIQKRDLRVFVVFQFEPVEYLSPSYRIAATAGFWDDAVFRHDDRTGKGNGREPQHTTKEIASEHSTRYGSNRIAGVQHEHDYNAHKQRRPHRQAPQSRRNPGHSDTPNADTLQDRHSQQHTGDSDKGEYQDDMQRVYQERKKRFTMARLMQQNTLRRAIASGSFRSELTGNHHFGEQKNQREAQKDVPEFDPGPGST